jgi:hypothetical protein
MSHILMVAVLMVGCPQKIERKPRHFNTLKIPASLQEALPFKSKPKVQKKRKTPLLESKRAVLMEPHERHVATLVNQLSLIRNEKVLTLDFYFLFFILFYFYF